MQTISIFPGESFQLQLHPTTEILSEIIREKGFYSYNDLYVFRKLLGSSSVLVDVGANLGWHTVAMGQYLRMGQILAIEPEAANFALLKKNSESNRLTNVHCVQMALSNYSGLGTLTLSGGNYGDHILDPQNLLDQRPQISVEVCTGDELFLEKLGTSQIDLFKIDAQGSECKILEGMKKTIKKFEPAVMLEYSPRHIAAAGDSVFEIFAFIEKNGYFPFQIVEDLDRPKDRLLDYVSIENLLSATGVLMGRGTGVDLLLLKPHHINHLKSQGFAL